MSRENSSRRSFFKMLAAAPLLLVISVESAVVRPDLLDDQAIADVVQAGLGATPSLGSGWAPVGAARSAATRTRGQVAPRSTGS